MSRVTARSCDYRCCIRLPRMHWPTQHSCTDIAPSILPLLSLYQIFSVVPLAIKESYYYSFAFHPLHPPSALEVLYDSHTI